MPAPPRRPVVAAAFGALALGVVTGCSSTEPVREYSVPTSLCGRSVPVDELSAFLPAGSKIAMEDTEPVARTYRCVVSVDGKRVLVASREWWEKKDDVAAVAFAHARVKSGTQTGDGRLLYSDHGAVGMTRCVDKEFPSEVLFTVIENYTDEGGDAQGMLRLITSYTKSVEQSGECR